MSDTPGSDFAPTDCQPAEVRCHDCCEGKRTGMFPKYAVDETGPMIVAISCDRCNGTGMIPEAMLQWIDIGQQCRFLRETEDLGLREAAVAYWIRPSTLSRIERGMTDPTEHAKRMGVL